MLIHHIRMTSISKANRLFLLFIKAVFCANSILIVNRSKLSVFCVKTGRSHGLSFRRRSFIFVGAELHFTLVSIYVEYKIEIIFKASSRLMFFAWWTLRSNSILFLWNQINSDFILTMRSIGRSLIGNNRILKEEWSPD